MMDYLDEMPLKLILWKAVMFNVSPQYAATV
jgi:hypothetical protein